MTDRRDLFARASGTLAVAALAVALTIGLAVVPAAPAAADWLVTADGQRIETDGPWEERGRLVVFTRPDGTLASMRASEVDLEASREATEEAERATAQAEEESREVEPRRESVASFTEADLPPVGRRAPAGNGDPDADTEEAGSENGTASPGDAEARREGLVITSWREAGGVSEGGIEIFGTLSNRSDRPMLRLSLEVQLMNEQGAAIESAPGQLTQVALQPGTSTGFRARFPGVFQFSEVRFEPRGEPARPAPVGGAASAEDDENEGGLDGR